MKLALAARTPWPAATLTGFVALLALAGPARASGYLVYDVSGEALGKFGISFLTGTRWDPIAGEYPYLLIPGHRPCCSASFGGQEPARAPAPP